MMSKHIRALIGDTVARSALAFVSIAGRVYERTRADSAEEHAKAVIERALDAGSPPVMMFPTEPLAAKNPKLLTALHTSDDTTALKVADGDSIRWGVIPRRPTGEAIVEGLKAELRSREI